MLLQWLEEKGIWFHSQNLNERGSRLWHGRAWLKFYEGSLSFHWEWLFLKHTFCHAYFEAGGEYDITLSFAIPYLFAFWVHIETPRFNSKDERALSLGVHHGGISWKLWANPWDWREGTPRWRDGSFYFFDFLLGEQIYTQETLEESRVFVPLPECLYPAQGRIFRSIWKRNRWPWGKTLIRVEVKPDTPIPVPGKGENSWDQGQDAVHSMTVCASTFKEAIEALRKSVLDQRRKNS